MFDFTTQAWIYLIISIIATLVALGLTIYQVGMTPTLGFYVLGYFLYFVFIFLGAYNISCLTQGECYTWSWLVTIMASLPMIGVIVMSATSLVGGPQVSISTSNAKTTEVKK